MTALSLGTRDALERIFVGQVPLLALGVGAPAFVADEMSLFGVLFWMININAVVATRLIPTRLISKISIVLAMSLAFYLVLQRALGFNGIYFLSLSAVTSTVLVGPNVLLLLAPRFFRDRFVPAASMVAVAVLHRHERRRIERPLCSKLVAMTEVFYSEKTMSRVIWPTVTDMRGEYLAAAAKGNNRRCRWLRATSAPRLAWTLVLHHAPLILAASDFTSKFVRKD
jgi:hypothetical protein